MMCGMKIDNETLFYVDGVLTTSEAEVTSTIKAACGGILLDSLAFQEIDGVVTSTKADSIEDFILPCGGLKLDSAVFHVEETGAVTFDDSIYDSQDEEQGNDDGEEQGSGEDSES